MQPTRRHILLAAPALLLTACGGAPSLPGRAVAQSSIRPAANPGWDTWVTAYRGRARAAGISPGIIESAFRDAGFLPGVIERDRNQPESRRTLEDYLAISASDEKISEGRAALSRHRATLQRIEARFGVPAQIVTAIWGLESQYGARRGDVPVISSTSTLAYDGRRGAFFEEQLTAALRILQNGDTTPANLVGSWAGAMGHTQFIPTSYQSTAVDFNGDGRRDIWSEDPTDALASTAAYLQRSGWTRGVRWGAETGTANVSGSTIRPQPGGPAFTITGNFRAIKRYNNSDLYAIGVGHLADRIAGGPPIRGSFPNDAAGMSLADRKRLQQRLTAAGFDTDGADGVIGDKTRAAIRAYESSVGLPVTGEPTLALLRRLG